ncbi:MAG: glycosyl transferase group 1, partial [uncultured bacterium]
GIPELVKDKINGLLFNPGDATDFNRKLDYLKQNPSEIRRMGKNARKFVQRFKWNNTVKNYIKLYQSLIG